MKKCLNQYKGRRVVAVRLAEKSTDSDEDAGRIAESLNYGVRTTVQDQRTQAERLEQLRKMALDSRAPRRNEVDLSLTSGKFAIPALSYFARWKC